MSSELSNAMKRRWQNTPQEKRSEQGRRMVLGRWAKMTPEQKSEYGKMMAQAKKLKNK